MTTRIRERGKLPSSSFTLTPSLAHTIHLAVNSTTPCTRPLTSVRTRLVCQSAPRCVPDDTACVAVDLGSLGHVGVREDGRCRSTCPRPRTESLRACCKHAFVILDRSLILLRIFPGSQHFSFQLLFDFRVMLTERRKSTLD